MRILFVCENPLEVASLVPVAEKLTGLGEGGVICEFASHDAFYNQGVDRLFTELGVNQYRLPYPVKVKQPFYTIPTWKKLYILLKTNLNLAPIMEEFDAVVCGIDSGPARILIAAAHTLGKPTFQVLVSLYFGHNKTHLPTATARIKQLTRQFVATVFRAEFLAMPNRPGGSGCTRVFVMGERIRQAFIRDGYPEDRVLAYGVPRYITLFQLANEAQDVSIAQKPFKLLYLPGAFAWHGLHDHHRAQEDQLRMIADWLRRSGQGRYALTVKVHPRQQSSEYDWLSEYQEWVSVLPAETNLYPVIVDCHAVIGIWSNALYEAVQLGKAVIVTTFPRPALLTMPDVTEGLGSADSMSDFAEVVSTLFENQESYDVTIAHQQRMTADIFSPTTPDSARLIAESIFNDLQTRVREGKLI